MKLKRFSFFILVIPLALCFYWPVTTCYGEKLPVVASIFPVTDMVKQVGGDYVDVVTIIPPGASPHTFSLKPSQVKSISTARIYFAIGAGLEIWIDKFIPASSASLKRVVLSQGIPLMYEVDNDHHDETASHKDHDIANPHIWLDPQIAEKMVNKIVHSLSEVDGIHRKFYSENGKLYEKKLDELDHHIQKVVSGFSIKKYVSFHPAWAYFAKRYGLESVGTIEASPGRDPTPQTTRHIIRQIESQKIRAVFAEHQLNPQIAKVIAREANVKVLFLDPIGGPDLEGRQTYIDLMNYNLNVLQEAMK